MKELNIIEASKMPNAEFEVIKASGIALGVIKTTENGNFVDNLGNLISKQLTWDLIQAKFIPIKKAVSFMEALEAYKNGKTIKCDYTEYTGQKATNVYRCGDMDGCFVDQLDCAISPREILKGEWYIKN